MGVESSSAQWRRIISRIWVEWEYILMHSMVWFDLTEPPRTTVMKGEAGLKGSLEFGRVWLHQTSSIHCDVGGSWPSGKVWVSLWQFDLTEPASPFFTVIRGGSVYSNLLKLTRTFPAALLPPSVIRGGSVYLNLPKLTRTFPVALLPPTSQWFEDVRCTQTSPNSLETSLYACIPLRHSGSRWFGEVKPPQTHSNFPCRPASPYITVVWGGSVWSNHPELTRIFPVGLLPPLVTVVRGGSVGSNRHKLTPIFPVGLLPPSSQWFEEVWCIWTSPNSLEPSLYACIPLRHSGFKKVWGGSICLE